MKHILCSAIKADGTPCVRSSPPASAVATITGTSTCVNGAATAR